VAGAQMAGVLPLVAECPGGVAGGSFAGYATAAAEMAARPPTSGSVQVLDAPSCSGELALRRITSTLGQARRADAQGNFQQAKELYSEVLKVQRSLSRAPLGSTGKSLRDVVVGVEARLQVLRQETADGSAPSSGSRTAAGGMKGSEEAGNSGVLGPAAPRPGQANWDTASLMPEGPPLSARDYGPRPTTRDGSGGRPATRDARDAGLGRPTTRETSRDQSLDGVRPSTRDEQRLKAMIDGGRSRGGTSKERHHTPGGRGGRADGDRPPTGSRPPTRNGPGERRAQDVSIRQVTGSRRKNKQQGHDVLNLDASPSPYSSEFWTPPESLSPCIDADESVELLE